MKRPKLLLFDIGGVLVENVCFERLSELLPSHMSNAEMKSKWLASPVVREFELGLTSPEIFAGKLIDEWRIPLEASAFLAEFASWPKGYYPGAIELLARLRQQYTVACLSNSNAIHWQRFNGFREHFHVSLSSHLLGLIKPDTACLARALHECGTDAESTMFFDDSLDNVCSASKLGIRAFHVCGLDEVERVLRENSLL
jgi:HAD superfamily hydrolase (TIGR01509 family)